MFDAVITSPPYPNEKDYTRTTRLESVLLGYMNSRDDLRQQKQKLLRSNSRAVYKTDSDESWVEDNERIQELADRIEARRIELEKTSGFERLYARVVRLYFGGMVRHLEELKRVLAPGAQLAYVVGDQASFFRILIRTGELLASIAEELGYEVMDIDLFRTRFSTATQEHLREEVVLFAMEQLVTTSEAWGPMYLLHTDGGCFDDGFSSCPKEGSTKMARQPSRFRRK